MLGGKLVDPDGDGLFDLVLPEPDDVFTGLGVQFMGGEVSSTAGDDSFHVFGMYSGILNLGDLSTEQGDDSLYGAAIHFSGVHNVGTITTGNGNDSITGFGYDEAFGIFNSGTIETGDGNDFVSARSESAVTRSLTGGGTINLGPGDDRIRGFGVQIVDGGSGYDIAEIGLDRENVVLEYADGGMIEMSTEDGITMAFTDVESFDFNDLVYVV